MSQSTNVPYFFLGIVCLDSRGRNVMPRMPFVLALSKAIDDSNLDKHFFHT